MLGITGLQSNRGKACELVPRDRGAGRNALLCGFPDAKPDTAVLFHPGRAFGTLGGSRIRRRRCLLLAMDLPRVAAVAGAAPEGSADRHCRRVYRHCAGLSLEYFCLAEFNPRVDGPPAVGYRKPFQDRRGRLCRFCHSDGSCLPLQIHILSVLQLAWPRRTKTGLARGGRPAGSCIVLVGRGRARLPVRTQNPGLARSRNLMPTSKMELRSRRSPTRPEARPLSCRGTIWDGRAAVSSAPVQRVRR